MSRWLVLLLIQVTCMSALAQPESALRPGRLVPEASRPALITASFGEHTDLVYAIKTICSQSGFNVYVAPSVQGSVSSLTLEQAPFAEAMEAVLDQEVGYVYRLLADQKTIVVAEPKDIEDIAERT